MLKYISNTIISAVTCEYNFNHIGVKLKKKQISVCSLKAIGAEHLEYRKLHSITI